MPLNFDIIYADPPWRYDWAIPNKGVEVERHYPTMTEEEICALEVPAKTDSVLYLWATAPKLREAISVIDAWGFNFKTCAVWDKLVPLMGYWFKGQHELLLVATRGHFSPPPVELRISSVIRCNRSEHSSKPDVVRDAIERWFPNATRLEMFSRLKRPGWESFGNQIESDLFSHCLWHDPIGFRNQLKSK
jgi:N6-adenosine-specific RNA methylase IME4